MARSPLLLLLCLALIVYGQEMTADRHAKLQLAPNAAARLKLLEDKDFVFDFLASRDDGEARGRGGLSVAATGSNFPGLVGQGMAMTVGYLGPCGMNTPHVHPRSPEFNILAAGGPFLTAFVTENGARVVKNTLQLNQATLFPQGAIHFEQNLGCSPAVFIAAFRDEDPGVSQVAQRFEDLDIDVQAAVLGYPATGELLDLANKTQANIAFGTEECLQRCGIDPQNLPQVELSMRFLLEAAMQNRTDVYAVDSPGIPSSGSVTSINSNSKAPLAESFVVAKAKTAGEQLVMSSAEVSTSPPLDFWHDAARLRSAFLSTLIPALFFAVLALAFLAISIGRRRRALAPTAHRELEDEHANEVVYDERMPMNIEKTWLRDPFSPSPTRPTSMVA